MGLNEWWKRASEKTLKTAQKKRIKKLKEDKKKIADLKIQKAKLKKDIDTKAQKAKLDKEINDLKKENSKTRKFVSQLGVQVKKTARKIKTEMDKPIFTREKKSKPRKKRRKKK